MAAENKNHVGFANDIDQFILIGHGIMAKVGEDHHGFILWQLNQLPLEIGQGLHGKRLGGLALGIKLGPKTDEDYAAFFKGVD